MRIRVLIALMLVSAILASSPLVASAQDTVRPEISHWGIDGDAKGGAPFEAWASVSDDSSGVRNVTLIVEPDIGQRIDYPLEWNGSLFGDTLPPLEFNHSYTLYIKAFDMADNYATSYARHIDRRPGTTTTIDPAATAPIVVGSSLALMAVVVVGALSYDRRNSRRS